MPFRFRLEPLITIRDNLLKEQQAVLARAYEARRIVEEQQTGLEQELAENAESAREMTRQSTVNVPYLLGLNRHEAALLEQKKELEAVLVKIDEEIERCRNLVMEANKELKIVQKLKEKRKEKYDAEEAQKETKMLDEIALTKKS